MPVLHRYHGLEDQKGTGHLVDIRLHPSRSASSGMVRSSTVLHTVVSLQEDFATLKLPGVEFHAKL